MTAVATRWQDVDGQYNSLCATLSITDEGILRTTHRKTDKVKNRQKRNKSRITRHRYTKSELDTDGRKPKE